MQISRLTPCGSRLLQPLREIGSMEKTQCWDLEEIQAALREAYVQGIDVESLYRHNYRKPEIAPLSRGIRPKS